MLCGMNEGLEQAKNEQTPSFGSLRPGDWRGSAKATLRVGPV